MFNFAWYDCYLGVVCNFSDLEYEMASVLYNVGAVHARLGAKESRDNSDAMKVEQIYERVLREGLEVIFDCRWLAPTSNAQLGPFTLCQTDILVKWVRICQSIFWPSSLR